MLSEASPSIKKATNLLMSMSMDEETRQKYEEREEYLFERKMMLQLAEKAGMEKGMAIAGRKVAINLVALGMDDDTISKVTGLSQEEIKKLREQ